MEKSFVYYHYEPSLPAAIAAIALFGISSLLHFFQMVRSRTWFLIPFILGCFFETAGYIGRIVSAKQGPDGYTLGPYIVQSTLVLVAPALFAASIYMELGKISQLVRGDSYLLVRRRWLTRIFVVGDVLSFLAQGAGGGLMASPKSSQTGSNIVVAGLFVQVLFFGTFVIVALLFHSRLHRKPTGTIFEEQPPYRRHMVVLYTASLLIFLRSIVRIVEFIQGFSGYIMSHEIYLYIFDALPMLVTVLVVNLVHPSQVQRLLGTFKSTGRDGQPVISPPGRKIIWQSLVKV